MIFVALILAQTAMCPGALRPTGTSGLSFTTFIGRRSAPTDSTAKLPTVPTETVLRWPAKNESKQSFLSESIRDRKSTRLNSSHSSISYAVFCLKKKIYKDRRLRIYL